MLWSVLPESHYNWKPDDTAMSASEMIRHVLEADYGWHIIINQGDMSSYKTPWNNRPFTTVKGHYSSPYYSLTTVQLGSYFRLLVQQTIIGL